MIRAAQPGLGAFIFFGMALFLAVYFTFAAVQGDFGVFRRAEVNAEARTLQVELAEIRAEVTEMENLTRRLSDAYLDLDLLDERARDVLGMVRGDEIIIP